MHPFLTQALAAERVRDMRDAAARGQLVRQARRARCEAAQKAAELPGPDPGFRQPEPPCVVPAASRAA